MRVVYDNEEPAATTMSIICSRRQINMYRYIYIYIKNICTTLLYAVVVVVVVVVVVLLLFGKFVANPINGIIADRYRE